MSNTPQIGERWTYEDRANPPRTFEVLSFETKLIGSADNPWSVVVGEYVLGDCKTGERIGSTMRGRGWQFAGSVDES